MRIVVCGYVASYPIAGFFWHSVSYALGFRDLGHEVWFIEDSGDVPWGWDFEAQAEDPACRAGIRFLEREMRAVGLEGRWAFRHMPTGRHDGMDEATTLEVLAQAEVLVNVSLTTPLRPEYRRVPHRLAIDTDPVFTQLRILEGDLAEVTETHTRLFTFGRPPLPGQRHEWVPTRQPVVLRFWPMTDPPPDAPFTTLAQWRSEWEVSWNGSPCRGKDASFPPYLDLPSRAPVALQIGLGGRDNRVAAEMLRPYGWQVTDARAHSATCDAYRAFIASSAGEFSVAKHAYVVARSGWFSERTCCFLASGRPAVVQDTGFSDWLPTGEGVLCFATPEEAIGALEEVVSDWDRHARAARELAERHFNAAAVCSELLEAL